MPRKYPEYKPPPRKKFNVHIEALNVNGLCVACLNYDRKMIFIPDLKHYYNVLVDIEIPVDMDIKLCFQCAAEIKRILRFVQIAERSYQLLLRYTKKSSYIPLELLDKISIKTLEICTQINNIEKVKNESDESVQFINSIGSENELNSIVEHEVNTLNDIIPLNEEELKLEMNDQVKLEVKDEFIDGLYELDYEDDVTLSDLKADADQIVTETKRKLTKQKYTSKERHILIRERKNIYSKKSRCLDSLKGSVELVKVDMESVMLVREEDLKLYYGQKYKYMCTHCVLFVKQKKHYDQHMNRHNKDKQSKLKSEQCPVCRLYVSPANLNYHISAHLSVFRCIQCHYRSTSQSIMHKHIKSHQPSKREYICKKCLLVCQSENHLRRHKDKCALNSHYICDCCNKTFFNRGTLLKHINYKQVRLKAPVKLYECNVCDKKFKLIVSLNAHMIKHTGLLCPICGKHFKRRNYLAKHLKRHRTPGKYQCSMCSRKFSTQNRLDVHQARHNSLLINN